MINKLTAVLQYICIGLSVLFLSSVLWQVLTRHSFASPATYTEELARFAFIWLALLGSALCYGNKSHLAIDLILHHFGKLVNQKLTVLIELLCAGFAAGIMCWGGTKLVIHTYASQQLSPVLELPMGLVYLCIPLSGGLIVIYALSNIVSSLSEGVAENA